MTTRAVATRPGQPTDHVALTPAEEASRQAESDANEVTSLRANLRQAFIDEGILRIAAQVPEWDSFERVALLASVWNMFGGPPNAAQALARDIYLYVRDIALPRLGPLTLAQLQAADPTAADPFGGGTLWPT